MNSSIRLMETRLAEGSQIFNACEVHRDRCQVICLQNYSRGRHKGSLEDLPGGQEVQNTKDFQCFCKAGLEMPKAMLGGVGRHKESSDARLGDPKRHSCEKAYSR